MGRLIDGLKQECKYCYREVDASGLEAFRCTNKTVNMETSWCRPKNANEPCSICEYCKPKEEMGMSIDEAVLELRWLKKVNQEILETDAKELDVDSAWVKHWESVTQALDIAIDTARKYQMMQADYNARLKADLKAILVDLQLDVEGQKFDTHIDKDVWNDAIRACSDLIQQKINSLKAEGED